MGHPFPSQELQIVHDTVERLNWRLSQEHWFDFEVVSCNEDEVVVRGGIDLSLPPMLVVRFQRVSFVSLLMEWRTDTDRPSLALVEGAAEKALRLRLQAERGTHIFRFQPEYYPDDFGCIVAARSIEVVAGEYDYSRR